MLVFVAHRSAVLLGGFDRVFFWEETYRLLGAEALWRRWSIPLLDLQADPYAGGSLVTSILAVPVVAVSGFSILGLKLVALLWSALGLVAWLMLVDRYWGRRAMHLFALGFVAAPPVFTIYNLIAMGSHAEVVTLSGLQLLIAYRCLYDHDRSRRALLLWGVVAGFSTWFTYVSVLTFVVCVVAGVAAGVLPPRRWPTLLLGFALGFSPWLVSNVVSSGRGLEVVTTTFGPGAAGTRSSAAAFLDRLLYLLRTGIPIALRFEPVPVRIGGIHATLGTLRPTVIAAGYLALYVVSWSVLVAACLRAAASGGVSPIRRAAARPELPLLLLFPTFVLAIAASNQVFIEGGVVPFLAFRVLVPALPAVFFAIAVASARLAPRGVAAAICALLAFGAIGTAQLVGAGSTSLVRITRDARVLAAQAMGHLLFYKHDADSPLLARRIAALPAELRSAAYEGVGFSLAYHYPDRLPPGGLAEEIAAIEPTYRRDAIVGVRVALGPGMEQVRAVPPSPRTRAMLAAVEALDAPNPDH